MKYLLKSLLIFILYLFTLNAWGIQSYTVDDINRNIIRDMVTSIERHNNDIEITVNKTKALMAGVNHLGFMPQQTPLMQITVASLLISSSLSYIVYDVFRKESVSKQHFNIYLAVDDDYGELKKHLIFSFDFNRQLYKRMNLRNLGAIKVFKIAPNFKYSKWLLEHVRAEGKIVSMDRKKISLQN